MSRSVLLQLDPDGNAETIRARVAAATKAKFDGLDCPARSAVNAPDRTAPAPSFDPAACPLDLPVAVVSMLCATTRSEDALERVATAIDETRAWGAGVLCLVLPPLRRRAGESGFASYQDALNLTYRLLHDLRFGAAAAGVVLAVEVPQRGYLLSPVETRELIDAANAWNVGVCVDLDRVAHIGVPADWLRTLGARVHAVRVGTNAAVDSERADASDADAVLPPEIKDLLADDRPIIVSRRVPEARWSAWLDRA